MKNITEISWNISEEEYRKDKALSYSVLAKYERGGFNSIPTLFDKVESPSLILGSAVDSLITGGKDEFESRFLVADFPKIPDSIIPIIKELFQWCNNTNKSLESIDDNFIIKVAFKYNYQSNWKPETRAKVIKEKGKEYYNLLYLAGDKTILDCDTYSTVENMVEALKTSEATRWYFQDDNPFDNIERHYQLKFKTTLNEINYRCMSDLLIVDYDNKTIIPVDLKTSYKNEYDFYKSFLEWNYQIQARLYWRIIRNILNKDDYFKDFKLLDYRFIVVSRDCRPAVWEFPATQSTVTLYLGKDHQIELRDPEVIGKELQYYLDNNSTSPMDFEPEGINNLIDWINKI